jgi:arsenite-transporting ATPase
VFTARRGASRFEPSLDRAVVEDFIDLAPPGVDELLALLAVVDALRRPPEPAHDVVVLDTAPTGHFLRLLALPDAGLAWVRAFMAIVLKYRKVLGLGELGWDLVETARDLRALLALLRDPARTRALVVTRAAALPWLETRRLLAGLGRAGVAVGAVLVNARTPAGCARCTRADRAEGRVVARLRRQLRPLTRGGAVLLDAPATAPPPRGAPALGAWRRSWRTLEPAS